MELYFLFIIFIFGLAVGSFLNVVIYSIESTRNQKSIKQKTKRKNLGGRSFCPNCKHQLGFWDLFPVFSWIFLGGKCRYCKEKISVQYPLVELVTAILFVLTFYFILAPSSQLPALSILENDPLLIVNCLLLIAINCLLLIVFTYDLKHKIIPDKIIYPAILLALCSLLFALGGKIINGDPHTLYFILSSLFSGIIAGGFFYLIAAVSDGRWMGGGDIKLAFLMGLLLGWPNILVGLGLGFVLGAVIGVALLLLDKAKKNSEIPFGPFLITGTWIALFFGEEVVQWYIKTVGL